MLAAYTTQGESAMCPTVDERGPPRTRDVLLAPGGSFARYRISRCIGLGGMGAVYEGTHKLLRKRVAIKTSHAAIDHDGAAHQRFLHEAEVVARIRHPNVVDISDVGVEQGVPFLVMEYLEGEDLAALLAREGRLSPQRAVDLLLPAVAGLAAAHRAGVVHRDVKPENVFIASEPLGDLTIKVVDFGVCKELNALDVDRHHTVAGTPHYMAPEQVRGAGVLDGRTDQYALGVLLYQCLTGVRPFEADSLLALACSIDAGLYAPPRELCPDIPAALETIVMRAMARRIEDRFPSTEAFGQALSAFASREIRDGYARDFAAERRSSAPPPRHAAGAALPASCAGWVRSDSERRAPMTADRPTRTRTAPLAAASSAAVFVLLAALGCWRALQAGPPASAPRSLVAPLQASAAVRLDGLDFVSMCRTVSAR